jgi:hypothetical protein
MFGRIVIYFLKILAMRFIQFFKLVPSPATHGTGQYLYGKAIALASSILFYGLMAVSMPACKTKSGCPTSQFTNSMEKTSRGNTQLFPKKIRKKMKKS